MGAPKHTPDLTDYTHEDGGIDCPFCDAVFEAPVDKREIEDHIDQHHINGDALVPYDEKYPNHDAGDHPEPAPRKSDLGDLVIVLLGSTLAGLRDRLHEDGYRGAGDHVAKLTALTDAYLRDATEGTYLGGTGE